MLSRISANSEAAMRTSANSSRTHGLGLLASAARKAATMTAVEPTPVRMSQPSSSERVTRSPSDERCAAASVSLRPVDYSNFVEQLSR